MRLRSLLVLLTPVACSLPETARTEQEPTRPNVVLILTDDQGYGDFSFQGNPLLETPNLDRLAQSCPQVARFYVSPVCSPTRASLLTGRYNYRTRVVDTWRGRTSMEPEEVTLAEAVRDAGYRTGIFGKWHLGDNHPQRAMDQGFDETLVHRGGGLAQPSEPIENARRYTDAILFANGEAVQTRGYCTDVYFDAAIEFIDRARADGAPFFAYVATNAPHDPLHDVPPELYEKYRARDLSPVLRGADSDPDEVARVYAMVENIDQNVGRLLAHLEREGLAEDTLVVFLCDNGPTWGRWAGGLRGTKTGVHEGGIRTPLLVRYGERLSAETRVEPFGAHIDLMPTILEAVGALPPAVAFDGRSLWPLLCGEQPAWPERELVLQTHRGDVPAFEHHFAVIGQRWKLVRASGFEREAPLEGHPFELHDLVNDPGEAHDLSTERPELVAELRGVYRRWWEDVSTTRSDNFAPPPIVLDADAEPRVLLQRNDWRGIGTGSADGVWILETEGDAFFEARLLFRDPVEPQELAIFDGQGKKQIMFFPGRAKPVPTPGETGSAGYVIDGIHLALSGRTALRVRCLTARDEWISPYQIELVHRPTSGPQTFDLR